MSFCKTPQSPSLVIDKSVKNMDNVSSHNSPCFRCNIAITNFLVSHTCEIKFNDVIGQSTLYLCIPAPKFQNMADLHGKMSMFWNLFLNLIRWIQLYDKKSQTFVDCCDNILLNSS